MRTLSIPLFAFVACLAQAAVSVQSHLRLKHDVVGRIL